MTPPTFAASERPRPRAQLILVLVAAATTAVATCAPAESTPRLDGARLEVVGVWKGSEADAFERVLDRFRSTTGASVTFTSTAGEDIAAVLDRRIAAGNPPDLAMLPQPGLLARFARSGAILPIDAVVGDDVREHWGETWQTLGAVDGDLYGLWFKVAHKSLLWYSISAFERTGVVPPDDLDGLRSIAAALAADGMPAFAITAAPPDAWTFTDWFENLYVRIAGPDRYNELAAHRLPWTDPSVATALRVMAELLAPTRVSAPAGDDTLLDDSISAVFSRNPTAAMVMEGDFVPGVVSGETDAEIGVDVDVFPFPGESASDRFVVGGGDAAVLMVASPGADALLRFLATPEAAEVWAARGGFVSPNDAVDLTVYPNATARRIARSLLEAGDSFRFDLSDLQPVEFGGTTGAGMWAELARFVTAPADVAGTQRRLELAADRAWRDTAVTG
jgi:ABC-type glycerol-3-phosphate transport system substrate-binding protein